MRFWPGGASKSWIWSTNALLFFTWRSDWPTSGLRISARTRAALYVMPPARNNRPEGEIWFVYLGDAIDLGYFFCCAIDPVFQLLTNRILTLPTLYDVVELTLVGGSRVIG